MSKAWIFHHGKDFGVKFIWNKVKTRDTWVKWFDTEEEAEKAIAEFKEWQLLFEEGRKAGRREVIEEIEHSIVADDYWSPESGCKVVSIPVEDWVELKKEVANV